MNITLWIAQLLLASSFIWSAATKWFTPSAQLAEMWPWAGNNPALAKITGIFDLLIGLGLVLPALLRVQPKLTVYAAYGAVALMIAASGFHTMRGEVSQIGVNIVFGAIAAFIAWGRQKKAPITPKGSLFP